MFEPDDFKIVVAGDLQRTKCYAFARNGILGYPVAEKIALSKDRSSLLAKAGSAKGIYHPSAQYYGVVPRCCLSGNNLKKE